MSAQIILATVSTLALAISLATLWSSHLARFQPVAVAGPLILRICRIDAEDEHWYIPQVDCQFSITNAGAKIGRVKAVRIIARYPSLPIPGAYEIFSPHSEVDPSLYRKYSEHRFKWIEKSSLGEPAPFILLPRQNISKRVVFDTRWDDPVIQESIEFTLEFLADHKSKWIEIEKWSHPLDGKAWSELTENGTSFKGLPLGESFSLREVHPPDLHAHTRGKEKIPKGGFGLHTTRLARKEDTKKKKKKKASTRRDKGAVQD